jgi:hypothetical protein
MLSVITLLFSALESAISGSCSESSGRLFAGGCSRAAARTREPTRQSSPPDSAGPAHDERLERPSAWHAGPWLHVILWFAGLLLVIETAVTGLILLDQLSHEAGPHDARIYFAGSAVALVLLVRFWRRYWFLASDLGDLVGARGGVVTRRRRRRRSEVTARGSHGRGLHDLPRGPPVEARPG